LGSERDVQIPASRQQRGVAHGREYKPETVPPDDWDWEVLRGVSRNPMSRNQRLGITVVAIFAIIAGLGEIVVGFTGDYLGAARWT